MKSFWISLLVGVLAGFGGGWLATSVYGGSSSSSSATSTASSDEDATFGACLTDVWGEGKYAAITANPELASAEDNLAAVQCYSS